MQKVHLISASEPLIVDLALTMREKGYTVSVSGVQITQETRNRLDDAKCVCYGEGWFPDKLAKDISCIVLGSDVENENPELCKAKELGLLIQSIPEFVFHRTKSKTRVVVVGSGGKQTLIAMIAYALNRQKLPFDYVLNQTIPLLPFRAKMSYEARIALIEGGEQITSTLDQRLQLPSYRPHIAIVTTLAWSATAHHPTAESYWQTYQLFASSIEKEGKLIYNKDDSVVSRLVEGVREDITALPYEPNEVVEKEGSSYLQTRYGEYPVVVADADFLLSLSAARLACRQLGIKDADFYQAMSDYTLSLSS